MRAGNAGFIKGGRVDRGGSPAHRHDDKSMLWCFYRTVKPLREWKVL